MYRIFISYRRDDSRGYSGRIYEALRRNFGKVVFLDTFSLGIGDWGQQIKTALSQVGVILIVISSDWSKIRDDSGIRIDSDTDVLHNEILSALKRADDSQDIFIIPVTVNNAPFPPNSLPDTLQRLKDFQDFPLRDQTWETDIRKLITKIKEKTGLGKNAGIGYNTHPIWRWICPLLGLIFSLALLYVLTYFQLLNHAGISSEYIDLSVMLSLAVVVSVYILCKELSLVSNNEQMLEALIFPLILLFYTIIRSVN